MPPLRTPSLFCWPVPLPDQGPSPTLEKVSMETRGFVWIGKRRHSGLLRSSLALGPDCAPTGLCSLTSAMGSSCWAITHRQVHQSKHPSPEQPQIICPVTSAHWPRLLPPPQVSPQSCSKSDKLSLLGLLSRPMPFPPRFSSFLT